MTVRINKHLASLGYGSRRGCDRLVADGLVIINGVLATSGQQIDPDNDIVEVKKSIADIHDEHKTYIFNKPRGVVCTTSQSKEDEKNNLLTILPPVDGLKVAGRLDKESEGLMIATTDGELLYSLIDSSLMKKKVYLVETDRMANDQEIKFLNQSMIIDGYRIRPVKVTKKEYYWLQFVLTEGRNRQIRKMCEKANLSVLQLRRIAVSKLQLGQLKPGEYRLLNDNEISLL